MLAVIQRVIAVLLLVALTTPVAAAGPQSPQDSIDPLGYDFSKFLFQLSGLRFEPTAQVASRPKESVLVVLGRVSTGQQQLLTRFVERGGSVLVATDRRAFGSMFQISGERIETSDPSAMYQGHADCFRAPVNDHAVTRNVSSLVVNRASRITGLRNWGRWETIATHPVPGKPTLAAVLQRGTSRIVVVADHSPFTNDMLLRGHNAAFAMNIVDWLTHDNRKRIAFLVDGRDTPAPSIMPMLPPDQIPPIDPDDIPNDTKVAIANRFLREVQKANALNQYLATISPAKYWRWIILIPSLFLAYRVVSRLLSGERNLVRPPELHAANASEARTADMLRSGSMRAVGRELARGFLRTLTESNDSALWAIDRRLLVVSPGVPGSPRRIRADVEMLGRLAIGSERRPLKKRALRKLARRIDELTSLHANGQLRFQPQAATT